MPARFRIYDNDGETFDRFTIIDSKCCRVQGIRTYIYLGFSEDPFHPQGFGQHGELSGSSYVEHTANNFASMGKRIAGNDLPKQGQRLVKQFMENSEGSKAAIHTAMTRYGKEKP